MDYFNNLKWNGLESSSILDTSHCLIYLFKMRSKPEGQTMPNLKPKRLKKRYLTWGGTYQYTMHSEVCTQDMVLTTLLPSAPSPRCTERVAFFFSASCLKSEKTDKWSAKCFVEIIGVDLSYKNGDC